MGTTVSRRRRSATPPATKPRKPAWKKTLRRSRRKLASFLIPVFAPPLVRFLARSWKVEEIGRENFDSVMQAKGRLMTLWHGRMLLPLPRHARAGHRVLVSPSADGDLVLPLLRRFGYEAIRGSSSRRHLRALREMLSLLETGGTIAITPDGPRGPRHSVNAGPVWIARETGYPLIPIGCVCDRARYLKSWDRFTIPRYGARVCLVYGEPLRLAKDAPDEEVDRLTEEMRRRMIAAEELGLERIGAEKDW